VPPKDTVPPPAIPEPADTFSEEFASMALVMPPDARLSAPELRPKELDSDVIGRLSEMVTLPPRETDPPPVNPEPGESVSELCTSIGFVTPPAATLSTPRGAVILKYSVCVIDLPRLSDPFL
jgi:hypothetical protein